MSREIKIRVFNNHIKQYEIFAIDDERLGSGLRTGSRSFRGLYIGLKDKSGQEAYLDDIIDFDDTEIGGVKGRGVIVYETDLTIVDSPGYYIEIDGRVLKYFPFNFKIIGNKHDNPELLNNSY